MWEKGDTGFEAEAAKCNSLVALREAAERVPNFRSSALDSVAHVKSLLCFLKDWSLRVRNSLHLPHH